MTVETEALWLIRRRGRLVHDRCVECVNGLILITLEEAVASARISSRAHHRLAGAGQIHFTETSSGILPVCPDLLLLQLDDEATCRQINGGLRGPP